MEIEASRSEEHLSAQVNDPLLSREEQSASDLSATAITSLLENVKQQELSIEDDIRATSGANSSSVDEWIAQAKKVQRDIARCKVEATEILRGHDEVKNLRLLAHDAENKVQLLQGEVSFTATLQQELKAIAEVKRTILEVEDQLSIQKPVHAAAQLSQITAKTAELRSINARDILQNRQRQLVHDAYRILEVDLATQINIGTNANGDTKESSISFYPGDHTSGLLRGMKQLGTLEKATEALASSIDRSFMKPLLSTNSVPSVIIETDRLRIKSTRQNGLVATESLVGMMRQVVKFLYTHLPDLVVDDIGQRLMPGVVSSLIGTRLSNTIPTELSHTVELQSTRNAVSALADDLRSFRWPGHKELQLWVGQLPLIWLERRKMASLNALRRALSTKRGPTREVERVERETVSKQDVAAMNGTTDDWDAGWDEDAQEKPNPGEDDEASGWGFDDDDSQPTRDATEGKDAEAEDGAEAWGWDDETGVKEEQKAASLIVQRKAPENGANGNSPAEQEIILVEKYTITDVPDHVLEIIGKDVRDAEEVGQSSYPVLDSANSSAGLHTLPSHTLAMYRAMATTYYSNILLNGNMHLYNDASYIVQKLREAQLGGSAHSSAAMEADYAIMERFARAAYAREMELQRTILRDILDGAQGFQNCTQQPYAMQCETAVSSAVDRIRTMHGEWRRILSYSALLQSIGSLVSTITDKITRDILDMEDISEPESQRLASFCGQVSALDVLFLAEKPLEVGQDTDEEHETVPQTLVYVPSWLRFQYLANILESSLVDIKYLWKEGELRMEFTAEEVVDLIRALFAETRQRRDAIAEIRS